MSRTSAPCALALLLLLASAADCLDRPVAPATPQVSARVELTDSATTISKIDLLFMIDNSPSMADKQLFLRSAIFTFSSITDRSSVRRRRRQRSPYGSHRPGDPAVSCTYDARLRSDRGHSHRDHLVVVGRARRRRSEQRADASSDLHENDKAHLLARGEGASATGPAFLVESVARRGHLEERRSQRQVQLTRARSGTARVRLRRRLKR